MVMSKEEKQAYNKAYQQANKEKLTIERFIYREKNKEQIKNYRKTANYKKSKSISDWKRLGIIHDDYEKLYSDYLACNNCQVCYEKFKSTRDRHADHDHITGKFRQFLCCKCNMYDNWKKVILRRFFDFWKLS